MQTAVPLHIMVYEQKGGPSPEDLARAVAMSGVLGEHGDELLFKSKKPGRTAELFNQTADAVAVLAFCPGGVSIFGQHFVGRVKPRKRSIPSGLLEASENFSKTKS